MRLSISTDDWEGNLTKIGIALGDLARRQELGRVRELRVVDGNVAAWVIRDRRAGITEGKPMGKCQGVGDEQIPSLIVGLDIGTTKICAVVGKLFDSDQLKNDRIRQD